MTVVVTGLHHEYIVLGDSRFLGKFLSQEVCHQVQVAVKQPAHQSECKHVAAFQHALVVHSAVFQTVLHHLGDRTLHHPVAVDAHLCEIVVGGKLCLAQV